jgi:hypothetical protein
MIVQILLVILNPTLVILYIAWILISWQGRMHIVHNAHCLLPVCNNSWWTFCSFSAVGGSTEYLTRFGSIVGMGYATAVKLDLLAMNAFPSPSSLDTLKNCSWLLVCLVRGKHIAQTCLLVAATSPCVYSWAGGCCWVCVICDCCLFFCIPSDDLWVQL